MPEGEARSDLRDRPVADLVRDFSEQATALLRKEIELAKAELAVKGKRAGAGAGMFGGAGMIGFYAFGALTATLILALATAMAAWLAALIVALVYGAVAGALALRGRSKVQAATPPVPEEAVGSTKEDIRWVKSEARSARR